MGRELTDDEKRRIAANKAEALRRAEERRKREALVATEVLFRIYFEYVEWSLEQRVHLQFCFAEVEYTNIILPEKFCKRTTKFKPPISANLPKSNVHVSLTVFTNDKVKAVNVTLESIPDNVLRLLSNHAHVKQAVPSDMSLIMDPSLIEKLFPFQKAGVTFGIERGGRILLADEMGLGKSVQALALARYYKSEWPLLIICPSSVKTAWRMDESHMLKDGKAKRTQVAYSLSKRASRVILLSGTPALSRPAELFSQIRLVNDKLFPNFQDFAVRYCDGKQGRFCFEAKGCTNSEELNAILSKRVMIRRLKSQVLTELPDKRREVVYLSGDKIDSRMDSLQKARKTFEANRQLHAGNAKDPKECLLEYFSLTGIVKADAVCSHILENYFYPDAPKRKVLIFAHHQIVLDSVQVEVQKRNLRSIRIDGQTLSKDRGNLCQEFQENPDVMVAILSLSAAGVGITLTAASVVVFAELHWNPGTLLQAEDRAHRVGQKDSVFVQYLIAKNTADDIIWPLVQRKLDVLGQVNLSNETFRHANQTHMKVESSTNLEITDFFTTDDVMQNDYKKAKLSE
ncbi:helicase protein [Dictyocaulus viviparus]|uniref:Helicase protein n=1 Tax=Dictyocaulus viviparus TaxID=29172 RepID=A0A0D8XLT1_DICVI|nr:helicase protein [Dictyocaulus viviparus]